MKIRELITGKKVSTIGPSASVEELTIQLKELNVGALVVTGEDNSIDGIVSERDIVRAIPGHLGEFSGLKVRDLMSTRVLTCTEETTISELMETMTKNRIRHMPVIDKAGKLISIVSIGDVVKKYTEELDGDRQALQNYIVGG
jgi:CBS domain-containing protein